MPHPRLARLAAVFQLRWPIAMYAAESGDYLNALHPILLISSFRCQLVCTSTTHRVALVI